MYINRPIYLDKLINFKDKDIVKVITGIRRCGKTVLLFELYYNYLLEKGVEKDNIIKLSLDNIKNLEIRNPVKLYEYISSKIKNDNKYYIFLDEIQMVDKFEEVVNGLKEEYNCDIYLTGSNSKLLSSDINTVFRGRSIEIKVYPLSFKEYYDFYGGDKRKLFNEYMYFGGLPYLLQLDGEQRVEYLKVIEETVATKDIIEKHHIKNIEAFDGVFNLLCSSIGSYVSANKIANTLRSNGLSTINDETVSNYLNYLCDSFLFYKVNRYDIKGKEYLKTLNKYYISDIGIRNSKLNYRQIEITHSLENIVYLELKRRGYTVDIGKNNNKEIDFVVRSERDT